MRIPQYLLSRPSQDPSSLPKTSVPFLCNQKEVFQLFSKPILQIKKHIKIVVAHLKEPHVPTRTTPKVIKPILYPKSYPYKSHKHRTPQTLLGIDTDKGNPKIIHKANANAKSKLAARHIPSSSREA